MAADRGPAPRDASTMLTKEETFLRTGAFDPEEMSFFLAKTVERNKGQALRIASELSWATESGFNAAKLLAYEQRLQRMLARLPIASLCLYDRRRGSARVLNDALRLHPLVFTGDGVDENPAYVEPIESPRLDAPAEERRPIRIADLRDLPGPLA